MFPRYQAALFDMNGVIVDDEALHEAAFRRVLEGRGFTLSHRDYLDCFAGRTDRDGFLAFLSPKGDVSDIASLLKKKAEAYEFLSRSGLQPYPGVLELIASLKARAIPMALVTSATRSEAQMVLHSFKLTKAFRTVLTANDITEGKPSPQGYLLAAERLRVGPDACVVVEDAPSGIQAAKKAGMYCVAVKHTHMAEELAAADLGIDRFDEEGMKQVRNLFVSS